MPDSLKEAGEYIPWGVAIFSAVVTIVSYITGYTRLQSMVEANTKTLEEHQKLLTSGNGGGAPFLTEPEHDKLQIACRLQLDTRMVNTEKSVFDLCRTMKANYRELHEFHIELASLRGAISADIREIVKDALSARRKGDE